jgi:hemerythrin-like domain-containing protein
MNFQRRVSRALDDEHRLTLELLARVERAFTQAPPSKGEFQGELGALADRLTRHVHQEIDRHFAFEERLFPRLENAGEGDIVSLLSEEHEAIRTVENELVPLARDAAAGALDSAGWAVLRRTVLELVERLLAHIDKETRALLPLLDDLLDEAADSELAIEYATG